MTFLLYCDYGRKTGGGHLARMIGIAQELEIRNLPYAIYPSGNFKDSFLANLINPQKVLSSNSTNSKNFDILIIDSYNFKILQKIKKLNFGFNSTFQLIDNDSLPLTADGYFVVSPISQTAKDNFDSRILYGYPNFWPIFRNDFYLNQRASKNKAHKFSISISFGELYNEKYLSKCIEALDLVDLETDIFIFSDNHDKFSSSKNIYSMNPENYMSQMIQCDLAITGGGVSMLEAIYKGVPNLHVQISKNQEFQSHYFTEKLLTSRLDIMSSSGYVASQIEHAISNYDRIGSYNHNLVTDGRQKLIDKCIELAG
jgi:spore coat polysaccharide biosynthesis predicted glycosyltransferase SpsG